MDDLEKWRDEFPILSRTVYMISNSLGAMPRETARNLAAYADAWATRGVRAWEDRWWEMPREVGDKVARVIGAPDGSVSMHENVTTAHLVALSRDRRHGHPRHVPVGRHHPARRDGARRRLRGRRLPEMAVRRSRQCVSLYAPGPAGRGEAGAHGLGVAPQAVRLRRRRRRSARRC